MKPFIAIDHTLPDHHRHQEFDTLEDAQAHVDSNLPNGFATNNPGGREDFWVVDMTAKTITQDTEAEASFIKKRNVKREIERLETLPRKIREELAALGSAYAIAEEEAIALERANL